MADQQVLTPTDPNFAAFVAATAGARAETDATRAERLRTKAVSDAVPTQIAPAIAAARAAASDAIQKAGLLGSYGTEAELSGKAAGQYRVGVQYVTWSGSAVTSRTDVLTTQATLSARGPVYVPDIIRNAASPTEAASLLNAALALYKDRREIYFPAEFGAYLIDHANPASGLSGLVYWPGQTLRGDGTATTLKYATPNVQYSHLMRPATVAGAHAYARLLDMTIDHNCSQLLLGTATVDISSTQHTHTRLVYRNTPLVALFADSPESNPTLGALIENLQAYDSFGVALSTFGSCEEFSLVGAMRFERIRDDCIAFQESNRGYQRNHSVAGSAIMRQCGTRNFVPGSGGPTNDPNYVPDGYSQPVAVRLLGVEGFTYTANTDADGMATSVIHSIGTITLPPIQRFGAGRKNKDISFSNITARRTGHDTPPITGYPNLGHAVDVVDTDRFTLSNSTLSDSIGNNVDLVRCLDAVLRDVKSSGAQLGLHAWGGSTVKVIGGDYFGNGQGIQTENAGTWVDLTSTAAGKQAIGLYAASGSLITGDDVQAIGITGAPVVQDGGKVQVTGLRTAPGPLNTRGTVTLDSGNVSSQPSNGLGQAPGVVRATVVSSSDGLYAGRAYARFATNPMLIFVAVDPAPAAGQTVTVLWEAGV